MLRADSWIVCSMLNLLFLLSPSPSFFLSFSFIYFSSSSTTYLFIFNLLFRYAHEHGCPWDAGTCARAAIKGRLDILTYVILPLSPSSFGFYFLFFYHLFLLYISILIQFIRYLHENECPWDTRTCSYAARGGFLNCLAYVTTSFLPSFLPFPLLLLLSLLSSPLLSSLLYFHRYAHEHGCAWDALTYEAAKRSHHPGCLEYARQHGCPSE